MRAAEADGEASPARPRAEAPPLPLAPLTAGKDDDGDAPLALPHGGATTVRGEAMIPGAGLLNAAAGSFGEELVRSASCGATTVRGEAMIPGAGLLNAAAGSSEEELSSLASSALSPPNFFPKISRISDGGRTFFFKSSGGITGAEPARYNAACGGGGTGASFSFRLEADAERLAAPCSDMPKDSADSVQHCFPDKSAAEELSPGTT